MLFSLLAAAAVVHGVADGKCGKVRPPRPAVDAKLLLDHRRRLGVFLVLVVVDGVACRFEG